MGGGGTRAKIIAILGSPADIGSTECPRTRAIGCSPYVLSSVSFFLFFFFGN